ncbi:MAG TPA: hypothetical protein VM434_19795 [Beijerinckiaceae bacterium]|nr:hypothetical protein [Beijerinckiaceae bacterium]
MPRYFFHVRTDTEFIPDEQGAVLRDVKGAHRHALAFIQRVLPAVPDEDLRRWRLEVASEDGDERLTVLFPARPKPQRERLRSSG